MASRSREPGLSEFNFLKIYSAVSGPVWAENPLGKVIYILDFSGQANGDAKAYAKLKAKGFQLHWQSAPKGKQAEAKKASNTKFTCPACAQNAWAKPDALLICGNCYEDGEGDICLMLAEPGEDAEAA